MLIEEDEDEEDCHYAAEGCHVKNVGDLTIYYNNFCIMATAVQQPPPPPPPPRLASPPTLAPTNYTRAVVGGGPTREARLLSHLMLN